MTPAHPTPLSSAAALLEAARDAWCDFAYHVAHCVECGEMMFTSCREGNEMHEAAKEADRAASAAARQLRAVEEVLATMPEEPTGMRTDWLGWADYNAECADFVARLRTVLSREGSRDG